ncbi:hypothetical protein HCB38_07805 [Listeria sp. FSL L7-0083]|uniref:3D domain-containing protein n=1 Tax=Listeria farberi TaxID=2713500 RepID=UPI001626FC96|nr:3D domain-containing protein [Listeria farberi]MBC2267715.1 hypothetical protein [Listeria farberi]
MLTTALSTGISPQLPSKEAAQLSVELAPNAQIWRVNSEVKSRQVAELKDVLSERDKEIERLNSRVNDEPTNKTQITKTSENDGETTWQTGEFTAYYPANNALQGGTVTAKGDNLCDSLYYDSYQIVAAPPEIPFDTVLEIEVDGQVIKAIVRDRGGAIKGNKFDVAMSNKTNAYEFGRKSGRWRIVE